MQRPLCQFLLQQCEGCMSRWCQCQMGPRWDQVTRNPFTSMVFTSMVWWRKGTQFPTQRVLDAIQIWEASCRLKLQLSLWRSPEFALQLTHEDFHLGWCSRMAST